LNVIGVVLAGGQSRRMGGAHKGMLKLKTKPLCLHVIERLRIQTDVIVLNVNEQKEFFEKFKLPIIEDSIAGYAGPLAGVLAGMDWAYENGYNYILTVAVDTPFFPKDLLKKCKSTLLKEHCPIVLASTNVDHQVLGNLHPTFGLWNVNLRDDLRNSLNNGVRKMLAWTDRHQVKYCKFSVSKFNPFFNINKPDDLKKAEVIIKEGWA